jgi:hypothetical protein
MSRCGTCGRIFWFDYALFLHERTHRTGKVGTTNTVTPATTPRKGFYIVDSVLACYPNWPQYAVAWIVSWGMAEQVARMYAQQDEKDYIMLDEKGVVLFAGGEFQ